MNATIINKIFKKSPTGKKTIEQKLIKLSEEIGELNQAYLRLINLKTKTLDDPKTLFIEESCDCFIAVLDVLAHNQYNKNKIKQIFNKKLKKWEISKNR
jgi:NTP pyrophosphatase (non-canonical NTP hydrolase)